MKLLVIGDTKSCVFITVLQEASRSIVVEEWYYIQSPWDTVFAVKTLVTAKQTR
jgi:hypothetical protein